MKNYIYNMVGRLAALLFALGGAATAGATNWRQQFTSEHPLIIVGDWDKPPYEFLDQSGTPAGSNIDALTAIMRELDIPCRFVLKEWSNAIKTFERHDADLILANVNRYMGGDYFISENIINYNRVRAASLGGTPHTVTLKQLVEQSVVLKPGDYSAFFFTDLDSAQAQHVEYQSPKVALMGLQAGDSKYFVWGEEPLRWKIREYHMQDDIVLNEVGIPVSEIHVIGHDRQLIEEIDDHYSRMKQRGEIEAINNRWLHPERVSEQSRPVVAFIILGLALLAAIFYLLNRLAKRHVESANRSSSELNEMMYKALHMGSFNVMEYNIRTDRMTNRYGTILPQEGLTLQQFVSRIHPDQQQEFMQKMELLKAGRERRFELDKRWNAGTEQEPHWLKLHGHAICELDQSGRPAYVVNAVHDVTHEEEEDTAARQLIRKYESLLNMPSVAMSFYDNKGWLITLNDAMKELCGFNNDEAEAERYWRNLNMFDIPLFRNALSTDACDELLVCQHMYYPDINVDRYIEFHVLPLLGTDGAIANYFDATIEITAVRERISQMHRLQRQLRLTRQRIEQQRQRLTYLLLRSERHLMRSSMADRRISFYRSIGAPEYVHDFDTFLTMLVPEQREAFSRLLNDTETRTQQVFVIELIKRSPGQPGTFFSITFNPVFDEQGRIVGHTGISSDITALYNMRQRLEEETRSAADSVRLKSGFMASMTHELRTPLNAINGFTSVLEATDSPQERGEYIRIIKSSTDMLSRLVDDILEASSMTDGPTSIEAIDVDFAKAFDDICLTLRQRVDRPGVSFLCYNPYDTFPTRLDIDRVQQVVTNFTTNAVKFTQQGHISLGYRHERGGLYIYCEDTGIGIPQDKQQVIFERFVKLDEFVQGTGMGLAICKSIVERCGGQIGLVSLGPGKGSTFWFWIPCELLTQNS